MHLFEATALWDRTLAPTTADERTEKARTKLREAFLGFRERAATLADEIPQDLRLLTVHDITHIDALWEIADLVVGDQHDLNPVEAFVIGSAFLLHDLGMSLSAYTEGIDELKQHPEWDDVAAASLRRRLERSPTPLEIANLNPAIEEEVKIQLLRNLHATHAETLATCAFRHRSSDPEYYLLESTELRHSLGRLIGRIAYSHWWPIDRVADEFNRRIGSPVFCPRDWRIDPLKLACLIRVADACHLDARRAPGFLRAIRKPTDTAQLHWLFQEHLHKPDVEHERVVFSTSRPFPRDEARAWWLCYDTLRTADRELRDADSLLRDTGRTPFAAKGIAGCDDPSRLQKHIPTEGWEPVDVQIKVTDVATLVAKLGGEGLYGNDPTVPLRELIQNAADAVRARRLAEGRDLGWGRVSVEIHTDSEKDVISILDNGIGMSRDVLCGPFLDFGSSYWGSPLMVQEHPGLMKKGFSSVGHFGIGFYSVFMWGEKVKVITRSRRVGPAESLVLEFNEGLKERPILRRARPDEQLQEPGTRICVWLEGKVNESGGLLSGVTIGGRHHFSLAASAPTNLPDLCAWLCPTIDVDLNVQVGSEDSFQVVRANDWQALSGADLLQRTLGGRDSETLEFCRNHGDSIRPIRSDDGAMLGRLGLTFEPPGRTGADGPNWRNAHISGVVSVGGFRSFSIHGVHGAIVGCATTAARDDATVNVPEREMANWASEQIALVERHARSAKSKNELANAVRGFGGETRHLPIALGASGWLTCDDIANSRNWPDEIIIMHDAAWAIRKSKHKGDVLLDNVLVVPKSRYGGLYFPCVHSRKAANDYWSFHCATLAGAAIEALASAWNVRLQDVLENSEFSSDSHDLSAVCARTSRGRRLKFRGIDTIRKPKGGEL